MPAQNPNQLIEEMENKLQIILEESYDLCESEYGEMEVIAAANSINNSAYQIKKSLSILKSVITSVK